jgi:hypothetical protein
MAQVIEWLPCTHKALSANPSVIKKKKIHYVSLEKETFIPSFLLAVFHCQGDIKGLHILIGLSSSPLCTVVLH